MGLIINRHDLRLFPGALCDYPTIQSVWSVSHIEEYQHSPSLWIVSFLMDKLLLWLGTCTQMMRGTPASTQVFQAYRQACTFVRVPSEATYEYKKYQEYCGL